MFARHFIDSLDFAQQGLELRGEIPVAEMPRLQDLLATPQGNVQYILRGLKGRDGKPLLELTLTGDCQLRCQRCLQAMPYAISTVSTLMPTSEAELQRALAEGGELDEADEIDRIPAVAELDVLELVEDEILLGLPLSPRHEEGACVTLAAASIDEKQNPFAILRELK